MKRLIFATLLAAGCSDTSDPVEGTQSLEVTLLAPTDPGAVDRRLDASQRMVTLDVVAKDADNAVDTSFSGTLNVYAQFLGTLSPAFGELPLATIPITAGEARNVTVSLPAVFGPTVVWIDNGSGIGPTYAHGAITGTSPTLWYGDPFIADLQTPRDPTALDALNATPLQDKQITVLGSRHGANGRLVVTSVFAQGYTVSDVLCTGEAGTPPCTAGDFDHIVVFTFSAPRDSNFRPLQVGQVIEGFAGGLTEFLGLTEVGFPRTITAPGEQIVDVARLPPAVPLALDWFNGLSDPAGMINFEKNEAGLIEVSDVVVCELDEDFVEHKQWKVDPDGDDCRGDLINVVSTGITALDPQALVGRSITKISGILRPLNFGNGNVWIIFPRSADDVALAP